MNCDVINDFHIKLCNILGKFMPDAIKCRLPAIENRSSSLTEGTGLGETLPSPPSAYRVRKYPIGAWDNFRTYFTGFRIIFIELVPERLYTWLIVYVLWLYVIDIVTPTVVCKTVTFVPYHILDIKYPLLRS